MHDRVMRYAHLPTKAVPNTSNTLGTQPANILNRRLNNRVNLIGRVVRKPSGQIGLARLHIAQLDGVAAEEVRDDAEVAIRGELVSEQLGVGVDAEDVGQDDDGLVGAVFGVDDVGLDYDFEC